MTSLTLLLIVVVVVVVAAEELTCDNPMQHVSVLASCGKVAMRFDAAGDRFVSVPNSAQTLCGNGANRNVAVCSQLPEATGKFAAGVYSAGVFNFGWFWACADVARSQNCTQVKGNFVDCWFSPVAMPGASWAQRTQTTTAQREVVFFFFFFFSRRQAIRSCVLFPVHRHNWSQFSIEFASLASQCRRRLQNALHAHVCARTVLCRRIDVGSMRRHGCSSCIVYFMVSFFFLQLNQRDVTH
jgi:hypothetical protein